MGSEFDNYNGAASGYSPYDMSDYECRYMGGGSDPEEPPRECGYCHKEEPEPDTWGVDEWGTCICDECAEELRKENEELEDCDVEEFPDCR